MRLREKGVGVLGVYAHHETALTAGRDRHVSGNQKGQAIEHPLLDDVGFARDQLADANGEVFVVRHGGNMVAPGIGNFRVKYEPRVGPLETVELPSGRMLIPI